MQTRIGIISIALYVGTKLYITVLTLKHIQLLISVNYTIRQSTCIRCIALLSYPY